MLRRLAGSLARRARIAARSARPVILMYHRVETLPADPWELAVTPERFAAQIALLMRRRTVVPLSWLAGRLREGKVPANVAAVTFDDGYADNDRNARPVLEAAGCPATLFVTAGFVGDREGFWWDALVRAVLEPATLPDVLALAVDGRPHRFETGPGGLSPRALHDRLHALLKPLTPEARRDAVAAIADWSGAAPAAPARDRAMDADALAAFARSPVMEVGGHTVSHPSLPLLSPDARRAEIRDGAARVAAIVGRPLTGFAYPFGDHDAASVAAVREAGFGHAVTTRAGPVPRTADLFALPRLLAADWDEAAFGARVLAVG